MADPSEKVAIANERSEVQADSDDIKASTAHEAAERGHAATDK